jgi:NAD(P)-dependent dehydrogenase (short-subunit alcohol dehydrogenase family)
MSNTFLNVDNLPVAVIVGATSKWQVDGPNTVFVHGQNLATSDVARDARWGLGGALALKFARAGHFVVLTTRKLANADPLVQAIREEGGRCLALELEVSDPEAISRCFAEVRASAGDPEVLIYNAGYMAGRTLPPEQELMEHFPAELFEVAIDVACRGPSWLPSRSSPPCGRPAVDRSCSPTTSTPCAAGSGTPASRCTTPAP